MKKPYKIIIVISVVLLVQGALLTLVVKNANPDPPKPPQQTVQTGVPSTNAPSTPSTPGTPSLPSHISNPQLQGNQQLSQANATTTQPTPLQATNPTPAPNTRPPQPEVKPLLPNVAAPTQPTQQVANQPSNTLTRPPTTPFAYGKFISNPATLPDALSKRLTKCRSGILVDLSTRRILWQKDATAPFAIASMSKIMTAYELICALNEPKNTDNLQTKVQVPRHMYKKFADCHVYMDPKESFTIDELLKCMMIHSANDCAYLIGEHFSGSEEAFVTRMNKRAQSLGLKSFSFCNTNGLPDKKNKRANRGSALDLAYLAEYVLNIPEVMKWAGTKMDAIREDKPNKKFNLANKNKLLADKRCPGINGLKTGYIDESKYCITLTCDRDGRKMICVVMGCDKAKERDAIAVSLLNWAYTVK